MPRSSKRLRGKQHPYAPATTAVEVEDSVPIQMQTPLAPVQTPVQTQSAQSSTVQPTVQPSVVVPHHQAPSTHTFEQTEDQHNQADSTMTRPGINVTNIVDNVIDLSNPSPLLSVCGELGVNVPLNIKEKIWKGEFLDLGLLLATDPDNFSQQPLIVKNGSLQLGNISKRKIGSIYEWTDSFLVFASIFLAKYPARTQELLKYINTVRSAHTSFGGYGWKNYDSQFRLRQASDPSRSWGTIDAELWLTCLGQSSFGVQQNRGVQNWPTNNQKVCYAYQKGACQRFNCQFDHLCSRCWGSHPSMNCYKSGFAQNPLRGAGNMNFSRPQNPASIHPPNQSNQFPFRPRNPRQGYFNRTIRPSN
ncbi:uncharacterized protein LOC117326238 isoform X2 [Pecten maximus]|uniref:uncharacterized protein LOC117326238 isoform X2 n=1 Tax=Pecten maximus TaxID=6579 RepID=UPI0014588C56|nr:uncharacterized protein LOC117326238 isoform X2 [Pecten maximus]XP_033738798.1 uncharacterized protein LOC117326238 isoform X2 [Pecten maximus]XP_033738799.1 uncharacterized protein LOC117326238 isoform X2 [Pecten maximus]XP_033738800.1 uncharacterized protein LOC117326238 isoform X2 [Pecten maximus]